VCVCVDINAAGERWGGGGGGPLTNPERAKLQNWTNEMARNLQVSPFPPSAESRLGLQFLSARESGGGMISSLSLYPSITISLSPPLSSLSYDLFSISFSLHILLSLFARLLTSTLYLKSPARGYRVRILVRNWDKCLESFPPCYSLSHPQSTYINRYEIG
jgi:hypothetical protein